MCRLCLSVCVRVRAGVFVCSYLLMLMYLPAHMEGLCVPMLELVICVLLCRSVCVHPCHQSTWVILCLRMVFRLLIAVCSMCVWMCSCVTMKKPWVE